MLGFSQGPLLDQLQRLQQLHLVDLERGVGTWDRNRGAESLHLLAGDADHRLTWDGVAHVFGLRHGPVATVDDPLDVRRHAALHVGKFLALPGGAEDDAIATLAFDDERLDVFRADVERRVVVFIVGAAPQALDPVLDLDH